MNALSLLVAIVALAVTFPACSRRKAGGTLHLEKSEVRVLPSRAGALYGQIVNDGEEAARLLSVESPRVEDAQLHVVVNADGLTAMRQAHDGFVVPAHGRFALERGGSHVMLFGVRPQDGRLPLALFFEGGAIMQVDPPVRSALEP